MSFPTYVLVTPARNEEAAISETLASVISQSQRPIEWVIVSDGSTDRTDDIVREAAKAHPFIRLLRLDGRPARNFASVVFAFNRGIAALTASEYDFIGLLDADVRFPPDYFEKLILKFSQLPKLGLAGGLVIDVTDRSSTRLRQDLNEVAGATQLFRRICFNEIGGIHPIPEGGWDAVTCIAARMKGFAVRTFPEIVMDHLKPRNAMFGHPIRRKWQMGLRDYALGYHPMYELLKCSVRISEPPFIAGGIAWFCGFSWAFCRRRPRTLPEALITFLQKEQLSKIRMRFASWFHSPARGH